MSNDPKVQALIEEMSQSIEDTIDTITSIKGEKFAGLVRLLFAMARINDLAAFSVRHQAQQGFAAPLMMGFLTGFTELAAGARLTAAVTDAEWAEATDWMAKLHERDDITRQRIDSIVGRDQPE
jgi:DNA-binding LytR/AlgR family response regulator